MLIFRSRGFIKQHLIIRNGTEEFLVQTSGGDQIHRYPEGVFQVCGKTAHLQATNGAFINSQVNITVRIGIASGVRTKQIDTIRPVLSRENRNDSPDLFHRISHSLTNPDDPMMEYSVALDIRAGGKKSGIGTALADMRLWIGKDENEIGILFREIEKELEGKRFGDIFLISSLFQMIFVKSLRNFFPENTPGWGRDLNDRRRFLMDEAFIYDDRDMTLSSLAKTLNISQRHAIRSIRAFCGMTFTQFRNQSRLSAAARLLAEDSMGISEIAEAVGFSSTAYFRRLFSQVYGLSPSAYRARQGRRKNDSPNQSG